MRLGDVKHNARSLLQSRRDGKCYANDEEDDEQAVSPDYNTFHILIKYFIKEKLHLLAYQTLLDMHSKGHRLEEELCSSLIYHLGKTRAHSEAKTRAHSEAFSVYNMLRYSKRTICRDLHEKILHTLIQGKLLKDAYVVVKPTLKKFGRAFMISGNINLVNDVVKVLHGSGYKIDQVLFEIAISHTFRNLIKRNCCFSFYNGCLVKDTLLTPPQETSFLRTLTCLVIAEILSKHHIPSRTMTKSRSEPKFRSK